MKFLVSQNLKVGSFFNLDTTPCTLQLFSLSQLSTISFPLTDILWSTQYNSTEHCLLILKNFPFQDDEEELDRFEDIEIVHEEVVDDCSEVYVPVDGKMKVYTTGLSDSAWSERVNQEGSFYRKTEEERIVDEFSVFGDCVANKLRSIDNPQARSIAQYYINTILFRAEMTNFQDGIIVPSPQEFGLFDNLRKDTPSKDNTKIEDSHE